METCLLPMRFSFFLVAISLISCSPPANQPSPQKTNTEVTNHRLTNTKWTEGRNSPNHILKFELNGTFKHHISYEGCVDSSGKYYIKNNQITFSNVKIGDADCGSWFSKQTICQVVETPNSIDFGEYLKCKNKTGENYAPLDFEYPNTERPRIRGDHVTIDQMPAKTLGYQKALIAENVVFRKAPSINAPRLSYRKSIDCSSGSDEEKTYIPKGHKINLLAQSIEPFKVQKWNDHWYYVCPLTCIEYMEEGCLYRGWIYGAFIKNR